MLRKVLGLEFEAAGTAASRIIASASRNIQTSAVNSGEVENLRRIMVHERATGQVFSGMPVGQSHFAMSSTTFSSQSLSSKRWNGYGCRLNSVRHFSTSRADRKEGIAKRICADIASQFAEGPGANDIYKHLSAVFFRGQQHFREQYADNFCTYLEAVRDGLNKAIKHSHDKNKALQILSKDIYGVFRGGTMLCDFSNLTARAAHLYGDPSRGGLTFETVYDLLKDNNRFALHNHGRNEYTENSVFSILAHKEAKKIIEGGLTPKEALQYAQAVGNFDNLNYAKNNPLSSVASKIHDKNHNIRSSFGVCS